MVVPAAREQVAVAVEGHVDRRVAQERLQPLRGEPELDPQARREVAQRTEAKGIHWLFKNL